jgi:alpha-L-fucosidase 2
VSYRTGGVRYRREVFASAPDQVIVLRVTADRPGSVSFSLQLDRLQDATSEVFGDRIVMTGGLAGGTGLAFHAAVRVLSEGGRLDPFTERLAVESADAVTLILAAATSFQNADPRAVVEKQLAAAAAKGYERCWLPMSPTTSVCFGASSCAWGSATPPWKRCPPTHGSSASSAVSATSAWNGCSSSSDVTC